MIAPLYHIQTQKARTKKTEKERDLEIEKEKLKKKEKEKEKEKVEVINCDVKQQYPPLIRLMVMYAILNYFFC